MVLNVKTYIKTNILLDKTVIQVENIWGVENRKYIPIRQLGINKTLTATLANH